MSKKIFFIVIGFLVFTFSCQSCKTEEPPYATNLVPRHVAVDRPDPVN